MKAFRLCVLSALVAASAGLTQPPPGGVPPMTPIPAPDQSRALPLYPGHAPAVDGPARTEVWARIMDDDVARNVSVATITPFLPAPGTATGMAIVVAPGGGFRVLSMEREGRGVAQWFADHGIAAFLLKYRVQPTPEDPAAFGADMAQMMAMAARADPSSAPPAYGPAIEDGIASVRFVREHAAQWGIDPHRVGMIGFSAGAMNTLATTLANQPNARPDFIGLIYGPMAPVSVPADAPPMFAALAADDPLFGRGGFGIVDSWRQARRPVELHLYQAGGHGFGISGNATSAALWPEEFLAWLRVNHLLDTPRR